MIYVNWKWRMRNNDQGYMACAEVYHDAIKKRPYSMLRGKAG